MSDIITDNPQGNANDLLMAKEMADSLHATYPGHIWAVSVDGSIGFADVRNLALSGSWGYRLRLDKMFSASDFKKRVLRGGGEMLERYRMTRGKFREDQYGDIPTDFAGRLKADM